MKFKVGDPVEIIKNCGHHNADCHVGETTVVTGVENNRIYPYRVRSNPLNWNDDELELLSPNTFQLGQILINPHTREKLAVVFAAGSEKIGVVIAVNLNDREAEIWSFEELEASEWRPQTSDENANTGAEMPDVELTMQEVADKFNVPVEKLRIRKGE